MNVIDYLNQIELYDSKLEITRKEIELIKNRATKTSASLNEKTQSSIIGDKIADNVIEYTELQKKLELSERNFFKQRHEVINFIFKLKNPLHIKVLYKKYGEYKALPTVAKEMGFSDQYVKEIHQKAIIELKDMIEKSKKEEKESNDKTYQKPTKNLPRTYQKPTENLPKTY